MFKGQLGAKVDGDTKANIYLHIQRVDAITKLPFEGELMKYAENTLSLNSKEELFVINNVSVYMFNLLKVWTEM